jgi:hypothetical protein
VTGHETPKQRRGEAIRRAIGKDQSRSLQDAVHCQSHHDRRDAEHDDAGAIDEVDEQSD